MHCIGYLFDGLASTRFTATFPYEFATVAPRKKAGTIAWKDCALVEWVSVKISEVSHTVGAIFHGCRGYVSEAETLSRQKIGSYQFTTDSRVQCHLRIALGLGLRQEREFSGSCSVYETTFRREI